MTKPTLLAHSLRSAITSTQSDQSSLYKPCHEKTNVLVSDLLRHKPGLQLQKISRGLKFQIYEVERLYYLFGKNKGADQLRGYHEADLRLCFHICKMLVFS